MHHFTLKHFSCNHVSNRVFIHLAVSYSQLCHFVPLGNLPWGQAEVQNGSYLVFLATDVFRNRMTVPLEDFSFFPFSPPILGLIVNSWTRSHLGRELVQLAEQALRPPLLVTSQGRVFLNCFAYVDSHANVLLCTSVIASLSLPSPLEPCTPRPVKPFF